jgi:hypothetical protein
MSIILNPEGAEIWTKDHDHCPVCNSHEIDYTGDVQIFFIELICLSCGYHWWNEIPVLEVLHESI